MSSIKEYRMDMTVTTEENLNVQMGSERKQFVAFAFCERVDVNYHERFYFRGELKMLTKMVAPFLNSDEFDY